MQNSTAKRYAKALYEIALTKTASPDIGLENYLIYIELLSNYIKTSHDLRTVLVNPAVDLSKRHAIVREIGSRNGWDRTFCNFICLMIDRSKVLLIPAIAEALRELSDQRRGVIRVEITAARPLPREEVDKIVNALKRQQKVAGPIEVETKIDAAIIGGVVARIGEKVYDASIRSQLEKVRRSILQTV